MMFPRVTNTDIPNILLTMVAVALFMVILFGIGGVLAWAYEMFIIRRKRK